MKQGVSPALAGAIIVVVVLVVCAIGYFAFIKSSTKADISAGDQQKNLDQQKAKMQDMLGKRKAGNELKGGSGGGSGMGAGKGGGSGMGGRRAGGPGMGGSSMGAGKGG